MLTFNGVRRCRQRCSDRMVLCLNCAIMILRKRDISDEIWNTINVNFPRSVGQIAVLLTLFLGSICLARSPI